MNFPNALKGIKKIYISEMLMLLSGALGGVASFFGTQAAKQIEQGGAEAIEAGTAFGVMIPLLASGIIAIIAVFIQFFGLKSAANDDDNFKTGYTYALIGLVLSVVFSILSYTKIGGDLLDDLVKLVSSFIQVVVTFYVITGIKSLSEKLGNTEMAARGKKTFNIYAAAIILASVVELAMTVLSGGLKTAVVGILGAVMLVLMVVGYILYLGYLSKAKKMLA